MTTFVARVLTKRNWINDQNTYIVFFKIYEIYLILDLKYIDFVENINYCAFELEKTKEFFNGY